MSATVTYKGNTLTTVSNETKTLETAGTWLEDDITITDSSSSSGAVVISDTTDSAGGTIRTITAQNATYLQSKTVTLTSSPTTITPDSGYDGMSSVAVSYSGGSGGYDLDDIATGDYSESTITLSTATHIRPFAFCRNTMTTFSAPYVTMFSDNPSGSGIGSYIFANCTNLTSVSLPSLTSCGSGGYQFYMCTALTSVYAHGMNIGQHMFHGCTSLTSFCSTHTGVMNGYGFSGCTALTAVDLSTSKIYSYEFYNCSRLTTVVLRAASVATLSNINCFATSPFKSGGSGGTIYVPSSLISSYQAATNWSTLDGYGTVTWAAIEGSQYENYYVDGTAVGS